MGVVIHFLQPVDGVVRVHLRGGEVRVAEHFLDGVQVGAVVQEGRGDRMPEHVGGFPPGDAVAVEFRLDGPVHVIGVQGPALFRHEEGAVRGRRAASHRLNCFQI